ncbi:MAG: ATP-binding protein [Syntrophobacter sp.]
MSTGPIRIERKNPDAALVGLTTHLLGLAGEMLEKSAFLKAALSILGSYADCDTVLVSLDDGTTSFTREDSNPGTSSVPSSGPHSEAKGESGEVRSSAQVRIKEGNGSTGYLQFSRFRLPRFSAHEAAFLESLSQIFAIALKHWRTTWSLQERVKELSCLYRIANVLDTAEKSIGDILGEIVTIIPSAWLYSDDAVSRIQFDGLDYCSGDYAEGMQEQQADIVISGKTRGRVQVAYFHQKPELNEGPFLAEERKLLDTIAKELSVRIERRLYEDEQAKTKEQLKHSNRLAVIGQLAAAVAHELNEPLTNILGFAQLAAKETGQAGPNGGDLEKIIANSLYAREIVRKLLLYGRKMPLTKSRVDVNKVVREAVGLFEHRLSKENIKLELRLSNDLDRIVADPAHLRQVVANLVMNSIHAMPRGGTLTLTSAQKNRTVEIIIRDTGCGMSETVRDKIFIPFFTTREAGQGTGLGLTVVLEIVTGLDGTINIDTMPGIGTTVLVSLPVADPER